MNISNSTNPKELGKKLAINAIAEDYIEAKSIGDLIGAMEYPIVLKSDYPFSSQVLNADDVINLFSETVKHHVSLKHDISSMDEKSSKLFNEGLTQVVDSYLVNNCFEIAGQKIEAERGRQFELDVENDQQLELH